MISRNKKIAVKLRMAKADLCRFEYQIISLVGTPALQFDGKSFRVEDWMTEKQVETLCMDPLSTVTIVGSTKS